MKKELFLLVFLSVFITLIDLGAPIRGAQTRYTIVNFGLNQPLLSVKIAMICLQKYLDLDQVLAVYTAPRHSYQNPPEKINCLPNIGLYGIGCKHQHSIDLFFEQSLSRCTGLGDVHKLIEKNSDRNTKLLKECRQPCKNLISETFSQLKLNDEQFKVYEPSTHKEINKLFTDVGLDETLKSNNMMTEFSQRPELAQYF